MTPAQICARAKRSTIMLWDRWATLPCGMASSKSMAGMTGKAMLPSPSRVQLSLFPFAGLLKVEATREPLITFPPHPSRAAKNATPCLTSSTASSMAGSAALPAITQPISIPAKAATMDNGDGGHQIWQLLVNDPQRAAAFEAAGETGLTPAETLQYAYKKRLMNDVHMSHAMEFAYPQSMANCSTCHEGSRLANTLTDNNFTIETCKSCHPVTGGTDLPSATGAFTVDTRTQNPLLKQAPALASILPPIVTAHSAPFATACNLCHNAGPSGFAPVFSAIHTGYDKLIYGDATGTKYSTAITVTIDNVSYVDNTNTLTFGFHATGSLGGVNSANIVPTILVGLYGFDTKDYLFGPHESRGITEQAVAGIQYRYPCPDEQLHSYNGDERRRHLGTLRRTCPPGNPGSTTTP